MICWPRREKRLCIGKKKMNDADFAHMGLRVLSCLKGGDQGGTYLCERNGEKVIVKIAENPEDAQLLQNEYDLLNLISASESPEADLFPRAYSYDPQPPCVLIRSCISGNSIEALVEAQPDRPGLSRDRAVSCCLGVLKQLKCLHGMKTPIIHRDIKPQNVIVDPQGRCHLIDLGISRLHRKDRDGSARRMGSDIVDTTVIGTRLTAPPEQFGFRQTDERSDLYSVGVLLRYCLTGEYADSADETIDADLRAVIQKATAFDPDDRYQTADQMMAALTHPEKKKRPIRRSVLLAAAVLAVLAVSIFLLLSLPGMRRNTLRFREPLIEQAVRLYLNKPEGQLTRQELAEVDSLHIFGQQIYQDESQIWFLGDYPYVRDNAMREAGLYEENGGVASLEDLALLPNLREVCLYHQQISDISFLKNTAIPRLGLGGNPITDLSPLKNNPNIEYLNLFCLDANIEEVVPTLPKLEKLDLGGVELSSFDFFDGLPLREINLFDTEMHQSWKALSSLSSLRALTIGHMNWNILDAILAMPQLEELTITKAGGVTLEKLTSLPNLRSLYFYQSAEPYRVLDIPLRFPYLTWLDAKNLQFHSFHCFSGMTALETLHIYASALDSYDGLDELPALKAIYCTAEQARHIREQYPQGAWELIY